MNKSAIRLYAVVAIIVATWGVSALVLRATEPPGVEMPTWTFREMPLQLGNWQGATTTLDPEIAVATGADIIVDRSYRNEAGRAVSIHTAMFEDPRKGFTHIPLNCYRANGWRQLTEVGEEISLSEDTTIAVNLSTWEKEGEKILVLYWYQLGEHVLQSRLELGTFRWAMGGEPKWPVLVKIMIQTQLTDEEDSKTVITAFAEQIAQWLNSPEHQKYLHRWPKKK